MKAKSSQTDAKVAKPYKFGGHPVSYDVSKRHTVTAAPTRKGASKREYAGLHEYTGPYRYKGKQAGQDAIDTAPQFQLDSMKSFKGSQSVKTQFLTKRNPNRDEHEDFKGPWGSGTEEQ